MQETSPSNQTSEFEIKTGQYRYQINRPGEMERGERIGEHEASTLYLKAAGVRKALPSVSRLLSTFHTSPIKWVNTTCLSGSWGLNELMHEKCLAWRLACSVECYLPSLLIFSENMH